MARSNPSRPMAAASDAPSRKMKYPNVPPSDSLIVWISSMGSLASSACISCWTRGGKQFRTHRGTNLQGTLRSEVLRERDIKVRLRVFGENAVFAVARNTYDLDEWAGIADQTKAFAYWVFSRPKMPSHRLVDNRDERSCFTVGACESAAEDDTNAECIEIGWVNVVEESSGCSLTRGHGSTFDVDRLVTKSIAHRNRRGEAHGLDSWERANLCFERAIELIRLYSGVIVEGRIERNVQKLLWVEAYVHTLDRTQAAHEKSGDDEQRERARNLGSHEVAANLVPGLAAGVRAAALMQHGIDIGASRAKSWREAGGNRGEDHRYERVDKNSPIK